MSSFLGVGGNPRLTTYSQATRIPVVHFVEAILMVSNLQCIAHLRPKKNPSIYWLLYIDIQWYAMIVPSSPVYATDGMEIPVWLSESW